MNRIKLTAAMLAIVLHCTAATAYAGDCVLSVTRVACSGKETESFKKCQGKASCQEVSETGSADACGKDALKACENTRLEITKSKTITATFDGAPVEGGKNFCDAGRPDFNKCG